MAVRSVGRGAIAALAALVLALACVALAILGSGPADSRATQLLSDDGSALAAKTRLLSKLRGILAQRVATEHFQGSQVKAFDASATMRGRPEALAEVQTSVRKEEGADRGTVQALSHQFAVRHKALAVDRNWKTARKDWKPYDPSVSLSENQARSEDAARVSGGKFAQYESAMKHEGREAGCKDWGAHPVDCIREAFGNHLKGTRLAKLRRLYDGRVTKDALARERAAVAAKVARGYVNGQLHASAHSATGQWVQKERKAVEEKAEEMSRLRAKRQVQMDEVARNWGSGVAGTGPDAGRRYFVQLGTGKTSFHAPKYVRTALRELRTEKKAAAARKLQEDAQLYRAGFQAAEREERDKLEGARVPVGKAQQQRKAQAAIWRFLHSKAAPAVRSSSDSASLQAERRKIAREVGRHTLLSDGTPVPLHSAPTQQNRVVDDFGNTVTESQAGKDAWEAEPPKEQNAGEVANAVTGGLAAEADLSVSREASLERQVAAQQAIIRDLEAEVGQQAGKAAPAATRSAEAAEATRSAEAAEATRAARQENDGLDERPPLTSWEMAKFANNVQSDQGSIGTNVVWMYNDLAKRGKYSQVEHEDDRAQERSEDSDKAFAADRAQVESIPHGIALVPSVLAADARKPRHSVTVTRKPGQVRAEEQHYVDEEHAQAEGEEPDPEPMGTNAAFLEQADAPETAKPAPREAAAAPAATRSAEAAEATRAARQENDGLDKRPPLTSWEMAKFANNVQSDQGSIGTNVVWMYNDLAKRGKYSQVEHEDDGSAAQDQKAWDGDAWEDGEAAEYRSRGRHTPQLAAALPAHLAHVEARQLRRMEAAGAQSKSAQQI